MFALGFERRLPKSRVPGLALRCMGFEFVVCIFWSQGRLPTSRVPGLTLGCLGFDLLVFSLGVPGSAAEVRSPLVDLEIPRFRFFVACFWGPKVEGQRAKARIPRGASYEKPRSQDCRVSLPTLGS